MDPAICFGINDRHIEYRSLADHTGCIHPVGLQPEVWLHFDQLAAAAASQGIQLLVASGFRNFDRQLGIWNGKACGERPVYDSQGLPLPLSDLPPAERCHAILRWSALPGASRHHWGTDLDVYDAASIGTDYSLQLSPQEYNGGPFTELNEWLESTLQQDNDFGFFRPYQKDTGGIAPEPWHLSYRPLARQCQQGVTVAALNQLLEQRNVALYPILSNELESIHARYINVDNSPLLNGGQ